MRVPALAFVAAIAASLPAWADSSTMDLLTGSDAVKWGPGPSGLPKGAMIAVISGDPSKDGPSVVRLKLPANYQFRRTIIRRPRISPSCPEASTPEWGTSSMQKRARSCCLAAS